MEKFTSSAKIIDGTLILTLPDAIKPVVWQMQLGQTKSSALEVRDMPDGNWMLILKTPRMDVMEIAPFSNKDAAVRALLAVSRAMEKAHGQLGSGNGPYPVPAVVPGRYSSECRRGGWLCRLMKFILYTFMTLFILLILGVGVLWLTHSGSTQDQATTILQAPAPAEAPVGSPIPADQFLNNQ